MDSTPADTPKPPSRLQIRALRHDLLGACDQQILRVVAMVDRLPRRGEVDDFIAPLRKRLAVLRPTRQMTFTRLLFKPLDRMIVAPGAWRRDALSIPRGALLPLSALVRAHLGDQADAIDRALAGSTTDHDPAVQQVGADLWAAGAIALTGAVPPPDWTEASGLSTADFASVTGIARPVLARAGRLEDILRLPAADHAGRKCHIEALLLTAVDDGPNAFAAVTTLLAAGLPRGDHVFMAADDVAARFAMPELRLAVDRAIDATIDATIETLDTGLVPTARLDQAAADLRRIVATLEDLEAQCTQRVSRKTRLAELRQRIDRGSREQFTSALDAQLLQPAQSIIEADDARIIGLEAAARDLRRFESVARRLGGGEHYDLHLKGAAAALRPQAHEPVQAQVDRLRLIEILRGPDAAEAAMAG